jgi:hypothetical protein
MTTKVNDQSDAVQAMQPCWDMVDALMGGTAALRLKGEAYLPKWPQEDQKSYDYRLKTSTLFNAFERTVTNMAGKPFSEPLQWSKIDAPVEAWFDDIDLCGRNLHVFAQDVFEAAIRYGVTHILVDYPRTRALDGTNQAATLADERKMGARPYAVHIKPSSILGWKSDKVKGVETLTQLRIMETIEKPDGEFGSIMVDQVRVLVPGGYSIYQENKELKTWVAVEEGATSLDFIPLITLYTKRTGFMTGRPPLFDLAELNIKHWQSSSDQDSILHTARVPILAISGVSDEDKIVVGAKTALMLPQGATAEYVEHTGAAIDAGRNSLKDLEEQMRAMGAELLIVRTGDETATRAAIDTAQAQCQLSAMAQALEDALDQMLDMMAKWAGMKEQGDIDVFDDFASITVDAATIGPFVAALVLMVNSGLMSQETAFDEMKRYGVVNPDLTWEAEQERIAQSMPMILPSAIPKPAPNPVEE